MLSHYIVANGGEKCTSNYGTEYGQYIKYAETTPQPGTNRSFLGKFIDTAIAPEHRQFVHAFLICADSSVMQGQLLPTIYNPSNPDAFLKISDLLAA